MFRGYPPSACGRRPWLIASLIVACVATAVGAQERSAGGVAVIESDGSQRRHGAIRTQLESAFSSLPHAQTQGAIFVQDLKSNQVVYAAAADTPLVPASVMKLFVMVAAISTLGPEFAFETRFGIQGNDLVVVGDGDPGTGDEKIHRTQGNAITSDFERWAELLVTQGLTQLSGNLVIDETIFDKQWLHPSWEPSDLDNWYAAPIGGLNFNDNCVDITASPRPDGSIAVTVQPDSGLVKIINKGRVGDGKLILRHRFDSFEYLLSGSCRKRWPFGAVSFPDPGLLFAGSLRTSLRRNGITIAGSIERRRVRVADGSLPQSVTFLDSRTTPLAAVLGRIGKDSQNFFSECLLKRLGYEWTKTRTPNVAQGSWATGADAIGDVLRRIGIDRTNLRISDGSGLSRDNACTARQLVHMLAWMHSQPNAWMLYDGLSVAGVDGSLRKRLTDIPRRVFAKTGTMRGIRTLAGYALGYDGSSYAFAVMFNGYPGSSSPYRTIQDSICRILVGQPAQGAMDD